MSLKQTVLAMTLAVAGVLFAAARVSAQDRSDGPVEIPKGPPIVSPPRGLGPPPGRGPGFRGDMQTPRPGQARPGGGPRHGGGPGGPGPGGGPRRFGQFGGPPRWPHHDWETLQKNDPEMYALLKEGADLDRKTLELAVQYRRAPASQREEIKKKLTESINAHFDVRQKRRLLEVKRLEEEIKRLRDAIEARNEARELLVKKRLSQLLGEDALDF